MPIRIYKPTSPGRRRSSVNTFQELTKRSKPQRSLITPARRHGGRNASGRITVRHRGGGHKRFYRMVDFRQDRIDQPATVLGIQYDPNRTSHIALIEYPNAERRYIVAPLGLHVGQKVLVAHGRVDIQPGNRTELQYIPTGIPVHNLELLPGRGGAIVRSAGSSATVMSVEGDYALVKLPSGEIRRLLKNCQASLGQVSNVDHGNIRWGKAGRNRWRGRRPTVRGKAMNPVDHPHGGGEGNQPIGMPGPKTPTGKPALGVRTRRQHRMSNRLIVSRRQKK